MQHYAGLDLSVKETSVCIINRFRGAGRQPIWPRGGFL